MVLLCRCNRVLWFCLDSLFHPLFVSLGRDGKNIHFRSSILVNITVFSVFLGGGGEGERAGKGGRWCSCVDVTVFCGFVWTLCSTLFLSLLDAMEKTFTLEAVY